MTLPSARLLALVLLGGCAGTATAPQSAPKPGAPVVKSVVVELSVDDYTRKERWFEDALKEELGAHGVTLKTGAAYVLTVKVETRASDHGVAVEKVAPIRGSTRLDGAPGPTDEAYREPPAPETPAYVPPGSTGKETQAVDDFRVAAYATLTRRGTKTVVATSQFDERALGVAPVARDDRPKQWNIVYKGVAMHVAKWLDGQTLP